MTANAISWIVAGAGLAAALVLFVRLRATRVEVAQRGVEAEKLQAELHAARKQLEKASARQRHSGDELAELRRRLEKTRRRAAQVQTQSAGRGPSPSRLQGLEEELEQTRQARDAAREEVQGLSAELSRLRAERAAQPAPSEPAPEPIPEPPAESEVIAALQERAEAAEASVGALEKELASASHATDRLRNKVKTQESLYLAMRGELEAKKDRLRRQQEELERLRAFKVAVVDPLPPAPGQSDPQEPSAAGRARSDSEHRPADAPAESESPGESASPEPSADEVAGRTPETA